MRFVVAFDESNQQIRHLVVALRSHFNFTVISCMLHRPARFLDVALSLQLSL